MFLSIVAFVQPPPAARARGSSRLAPASVMAHFRPPAACGASSSSVQAAQTSVCSGLRATKAARQPFQRCRRRLRAALLSADQACSTSLTARARWRGRRHGRAPWPRPRQRCAAGVEQRQRQGQRADAPGIALMFSPPRESWPRRRSLTARGAEATARCLHRSWPRHAFAAYTSGRCASTCRQRGRRWRRRHHGTGGVASRSAGSSRGQPEDLISMSHSARCKVALPARRRWRAPVPWRAPGRRRRRWSCAR